MQLLLFTAIAVTGIFVGTALSEKIPGQALKKGFGWFVLAIGRQGLAQYGELGYAQDKLFPWAYFVDLAPPAATLAPRPILSAV